VNWKQVLILQAYLLAHLSGTCEIMNFINKRLRWSKHSPSSFRLFNSCALVGRAYIPAATAFLSAHP